MTLHIWGIQILKELMSNRSGQRNKFKNMQDAWMPHSTSFKHMFEYNTTLDQQEQ